MILRKEILLVALAVFAVGCRSVALESMQSSSAPKQPLPYKGDPYAWGGIAEGTGGQVVGTKQTMETEAYSEPKFKKLAGPDAVTSMSGHSLAKAKPSDRSGDYQPLPNKAAGHSESGGGEGH
jgi:hypothetical protein